MTAKEIQNVLVFDNYVVGNVKHFLPPRVGQRLGAIQEAAEERYLSPRRLLGIHQRNVEIVVICPEYKGKSNPIVGRGILTAPFAQADEAADPAIRVSGRKRNQIDSMGIAVPVDVAREVCRGIAAAVALGLFSRSEFYFEHILLWCDGYLNP